MSITLSICIPTYNRSECLKECLNSISSTITGLEKEVEIVISDNASTDNTSDVIRDFQKKHLNVIYHRNEKNIGGERNFRFVATLAQGDFVWIFGDDDKMMPGAVPRILKAIYAGYGLIICNYSLWDRQWSVLLKKQGLAGNVDEVITDSNALMKRFGLHLGYISGVVIKKMLFLKLPPEEYEAFVEYGFPFLFAIYNGVSKVDCKIEYIAEPLLLNRSGNSGDYDWYKYFVTGSSLIFNELQKKGYSKSAVHAAKQKVLTDFVIPNVIGMKLKLDSQDNKRVFVLLFNNYRQYWQFWVYGIPIMAAPAPMLRLSKHILHKIRSLNAMEA